MFCVCSCIIICVEIILGIKHGTLRWRVGGFVECVVGGWVGLWNVLEGGWVGLWNV
jgi:hypothetical protein